MSLELLKEKFGYSGVIKETDNKEKIHKKLNAEFNSSNGIENLKSFKSQDLLELLKERFGHNDIQNLKSFKSQDLLDLLEERFGHSTSTNERESDNKEKINEKLNAQFNPMGDIKSIKVQHQEQLEENQRIIENLKIETSELANEVVVLEKEKAVLLDDLNKSKWMEDKVHSTAKKLYEDKIKTMSYVDSTELIPLLISVSREKQGNTKLNWGNWLKISENRYLFQINESLAKKVFEGTNVLIDRAINYINEKRTRGGDEPTTIYGLSFDGLTQGVNTTFGGSSATPTDRTYSFWMKSDVTTLSTQGVFGYGSNKREAFSLNVSQASMGKPKFSFATHLYHFFMTEDHEEEGGGSTADADSGAAESTAHIEAQEDGQWHHWMLFSDVSALENSKLYIDGVEQDTAKFANTGTLHTQQDSLTIGATNDSRTNGVHFEGFITNFAVYSQGNDASDYTSRAVSHYNNGIPKDLSGESGLSAYWKMDEGSGTTVADSIGGNDGTFTSWDGAPLPEWVTVMELTPEGAIR